MMAVQVLLYGSKIQRVPGKQHGRKIQTSELQFFEDQRKVVQDWIHFTMIISGKEINTLKQKKNFLDKSAPRENTGCKVT